MNESLPTLPSHPAGTAWPDRDWPIGAPGAHVDADLLEACLESALGEAADPKLGETHAVLAVQHGKLVHETYADGLGAANTYPSWSVAKSITHALAGILVERGVLDIHAPADVPEWQTAGDARAKITLDQLLRMSSGLKFVEDYVDGETSDVIEMLYGTGKADVAAYAASQPLLHEPDTFCGYSSGTTNIVARCLGRAIGKTGQGFHDFMKSALFDPIGMRSPIPKFDAAGTFIGSSFCFCSARDFARFGLLYMRDGFWNGTRLLPAGWVDYARTPTPVQPDESLGYGAHWWLGLGGPGSFSANGYQGQFVLLVPQDDLIIVRHGNSPLEHKHVLQAWMGELAACFRLQSR